MASCRAIHRWSLRSLIGAFLDLSIAYLFLCAASLLFLASKFLSFFHLSLPCPCNGFFGHPDPAICVQSLLVDQPTATIRSVHNQVRTLSPFDGDGDGDGDAAVSVGGYNVNSRFPPSLHIELEQVDRREVQLGSGSISPNSSGWYKER